jgi:CRISPR-associated helicase Cas3/CRISPR-associated endonuclease Cas3-HD
VENTTLYYAHSKGANNQWQTMLEHASNVARDAGMFASAFGAEEEARLCAHLHDAGKCAELFAKRLQNEGSHLDHWSIGAWLALLKYGSAGATLAIQGHHTGLQKGDTASFTRLRPEDLIKQVASERRRLTDEDAERVYAALLAQGITPSQTSAPTISRLPVETASTMLDVRMLFSALVDADHLDTEAHFDGPREPGIDLQPELAFDILKRHVEELANATDASAEMQQLRQDLWTACIDAGSNPTGIYTLTAPTGAGKTLSMLGFALRHAMQNRLRRVVIVIPFLSIIDQTAKILQAMFEPHFGPHYVLQHHSMAGTREGEEEAGATPPNERRRRQLTENWDAPIIVTTSVQALESLFANRPSACRKLHRLANSVILFDEVQTLPIHLAIPTLKTLSRLADPRYGSTVVFATATQPAFEHLHDLIADKEGDTPVNSGWQPAEIAPPNLNLFQRSVRASVDWTAAQTPASWIDIAERIRGYEQVLCIVNLRRHARELVQALQESPFGDVRHLSTMMCPAHRLNMLEEVKARLKNGQPCRLVSTSCVEAGVDISFPLVMRAFADLTSIAQAAGRCNRHGEGPPGQVKVFCPNDEQLYPSNAYGQAASIAETMLRQNPHGLDINDPELFREFYWRLYDIAKPEDMRAELHKAIGLQNYIDVAKQYRLIPESGASILVPYAPMIAEYERLAEEARAKGITRDWARRARPLTVSVFLKRDDPFHIRLEPIKLAGIGTQGESDWFIHMHPSEYDDLLGLTPPPSSPLWIA